MRTEDIKRLHATAKAVKDRIYTADDGKRYKGLPSGRLERILESSTIKEVYNYNNLSGNNVQEVLQSIDLELSLLNKRGYSEFTYNGNNDLIKKEVWKDNSKAVKISTSEFTYSSGNLTELDVTRELDGFNYTKLFSYDVDNNLTTIDIL
jgi:hypothetical protein